VPTLLITGSNRGIGLEFVRQYAAQGWRVVATCRKPEAATALQSLRRETPERIAIHALDVADQAATVALAKELETKEMSLDLVICNAGVLNARPFGHWKYQRFMDTVATNAIAPGMLIQATQQVLSAEAKIVFITSGIASLSEPIMPEGPMDAYAISKAAMNMMAVRLAEKLKPRGIPLVAVSPGWVQTDMGGSSAEISVQESVSSLVQLIEEVTIKQSGQFLDRFGQPLSF